MTGKRTNKPARNRFMGPGASTEDLVRAAVLNHRRWFAANAEHSGGEVKTDHGVTRMITPSEVTIAFPRLRSADADSVLDVIVSECRTVMPNIAGVWATTPTRPRDLGARLIVRGFSVGWRPHWMAMDFRKLPPVPELPDGIRIGVEQECDWDVEGLPYHSKKSQRVFSELAAAQPESAFHLVARSGADVVGHSVIFLTSGVLGAAGIYDVGVLPTFHRRGIGRALMQFSCDMAQSLGCHYAVLNSAASEFYESIGFDSLGWGQTWWMHRHTLEAPAAAPALVQFIAALARGDARALKSMASSGIPSNLDAPLPNGITPMDVAMVSDKPAATVAWLVERGATLDLRCAWDLGWRDRIPALLAARPDLIDRKLGEWQITPLHEAVYRGDVEFALLLLSHGPNLEIKDTQFHSTPLGWARHFGKAEMVSLIEEYAGRRERFSVSLRESR